MKNLTKDLPGWAKGIIIIVGIGILGATGIVIYTKINRAAAKMREKKSLKDLKDDLKDSESKVKATYTDAQFQAFAGSLFSAMDGWGTDNTKVMDVMGKMKNNTDILKLIDIYGVKTLSTGVGNPSPNIPQGLTDAFGTELSSGEINKINEMFSKNGIKFQF